MRGSGLIMTSAVLLTILVLATTVMASDLEAEKKLSERISTDFNSQTLENKDSSLQPHKRSKRTIGHIFDMFKNMMDGLFGGGKKKKPRRPKRPGQAYGPPKPRPQNPRPSYGKPRPRPPPPPRNPNLSGGYAGGSAPQRPPPRAPQAPQAPNPDSYGSPVAPPLPPRAPVAPNPDSYGSPIAPPQAPRAPAPDTYGSPLAPPIPQAPRAPAPDTYGSPVAPPQAPRAPPSGYSSQPQPQAPRTPTGGSFGPSSVFYMIPAPNLATEGPGGGKGAAPAGGDSYGSPQASPVSAPAPDSYGGPQAAPLAPAPDSYSGPDSYGAPQVPDSGVIEVNGRGRTPVVVPINPENPFLQGQQYNNAAPLPVIAAENDLQGEFVDENDVDGYGAPDVEAPAPITDIDTPEEPSVIEIARDEEEAVVDVEALADIRAEGLDVEEPVPDLPEDEELGAPDSAPVEATTAPADYDYDAEYVVDLRTDSVDDETTAPFQELAPEGEIEDYQVDEIEGELSPLFDNLRDVSFTSADSPTTPAIDQEPIIIDLSEGVADFTNGLDDSSGPSEIDLTDDASLEEYDYSQDLQEGYGDTTPVPDISGLGDEYDDNAEYETETDYTEDDYVGNEDIPPELPEDLAQQVRSENDISEEYEDESFGLPASSDVTEGEEEVEYEYYYDYEEDYEIDPEQLPEDDQLGRQELGSYSPAPSATESTPITTAGINNDVSNLLDLRTTEEETRSGRGGETNFISVPLMIEEVQKDTAPLILAGTSGDFSGFSGFAEKPDPGKQKETAKRRAPTAFHPVFQGWNLAAESPKAKRQQTDWSQRIANARRNRVWRQFNLD